MEFDRKTTYFVILLSAILIILAIVVLVAKRDMTGREKLLTPPSIRGGGSSHNLTTDPPQPDFDEKTVIIHALGSTGDRQRYEKTRPGFTFLDTDQWKLWINTGTKTGFVALDSLATSFAAPFEEGFTSTTSAAVAAGVDTYEQESILRLLKLYMDPAKSGDTAAISSVLNEMARNVGGGSGNTSTTSGTTSTSSAVTSSLATSTLPTTSATPGAPINAQSPVATQFGFVASLIDNRAANLLQQGNTATPTPMTGTSTNTELQTLQSNLTTRGIHLMIRRRPIDARYSRVFRV